MIRVEARSAGLGAWPFVAGLLAVGAVAITWLHLDRLPFTFCFFKMVTGFPCMTCGSTRALAHLAALDLPGAVRMNPLATITLLAIFAFGVLDLALLLQGRRLALSRPAGLRTSWIAAVVTVLVLVNWMYLIWARV